MGVKKVLARTIFERKIVEQHGRCYYCNDPFGSFAEDKLPTKDHVVPRGKGGANSWHNIVIACLRCNNQKGDLSLDDFLLIIAGEGLRPRSKTLGRFAPSETTRRQLLIANLAATNPSRLKAHPIFGPDKVAVSNNHHENPPVPKLWTRVRNNPPHSKNAPLKRLYTQEEARSWDEDRFVIRTGEAAG